MDAAPFGARLTLPEDADPLPTSEGLLRPSPDSPSLQVTGLFYRACTWKGDGVVMGAFEAAVLALGVSGAVVAIRDSLLRKTGVGA